MTRFVKRVATDYGDVQTWVAPAFLSPGDIPPGYFVEGGADDQAALETATKAAQEKLKEKWGSISNYRKRPKIRSRCR